MDTLTAAKHFLVDETVHYRPAVLHALAEAVDTQALPLRARSYIQDALHGPEGGSGPRGRLTGRFPSDRMGVTLSVDHGWLGLATLEHLERAPDVVAVFDHPPYFKVSQKGPLAKTRAHLCRPTLLVVYRDRSTLIQLVPEDDLRRRADGDHGLYQRDDRNWSCPPAQLAAREMGLAHEVWTESRFAPQELANLRMLEDYFVDVEDPPERANARHIVASLCRKLAAPTVASVIEESEGSVSVDDVFRALARRDVCADLTREDLRRYATVRLYPDLDTLSACNNVSAASASSEAWTAWSGLTLQQDDKVVHEGQVLDVAHIGGALVCLRNDEVSLQKTPREVQALLGSGQMTILQGNRALAQARLDDAMTFLLSRPTKDLRTANLRLARIEPYLAGVAKSPTSRTVRRYLESYRRFEVTHGNGFLGLIPGFSRCGNQARRLTNRVMEIVNQHVVGRYEDPRQIRRLHVHAGIASACEAEGLPAPSYSWFCRFIKQLDKYDVTRKRKGAKAGYPIAPRSDGSDLNIEPVRAFERAHIDHTEIDVETIYEENGSGMGRPWLTAMIDHYSRRVLGFFITYDPPSYRSVLMTLRDCVRRHNRLPSTIVVDGGKEFRGVWFQIICAFFKVKIIYRPPCKPRFGSQIERFFGTENTMLLHNLTGNTQATVHVRQMTPAVDPKKLAIWTLPALYALHAKFLFTTYDTLPHRSLLVSPRQAFDRSIAQFGMRPERFVVYNRLFRIATCPSTKKGKARVGVEGVKINYFWFNAPALRPLQGRDIEVRFEPYDMSVAYGFVNGRWLQLTSRFGRLLAGLSEKEILFFSDLYRARRSQVEFERLNDRKLTAFMVEVAQDEAVLLLRKQTLALQAALGEKGAEMEEAQPPAVAMDSPATDVDTEVDVDTDDEFMGSDIEFEELDTY